MTEFVSPPASKRCPDHSTCRNCQAPITWADYCYVHDSTGFADCWLTIGGADRPNLRVGMMMVNPTLAVEPPEGKGKTMAEPVEWGAP